ncbi:uncharacterized protein LOC131216154 [Anopheles bellator]|uniref:uncharacterized protein LOC131216154 n=1 Tax=Anopheles bellator TaxID=139047 RepID=UPI002649D7B9|nr:uncharacterized protein LOC131216154 [Anopheles bellator]
MKNMSSISDTPTKVRSQPKMLLRSTSFQKLCSIPYNFKLEAIRTYQEHIKTVIKVLKIQARAHIVSIYLKVFSIMLGHDRDVKMQPAPKQESIKPIGSPSFISGMNCPYDQQRDRSIERLHCDKPYTSSRLLKLYLTSVQTCLAYSCVLYVGFQIVFLLHILYCSAAIPFGLIFLIVDLAYMGFILSKIAQRGKYCPAQP